MAQKEDVMRVMYERCCGLDIHKSSITACALISEKGKTQEETRRFGTMTGDLRELAGWLQQKGIRHVAMGINGRVLEAGVEHFRAGGVRVTAGQRARGENRAGTKDRPERQPMDCGSA